MASEERMRQAQDVIQGHVQQMMRLRADRIERAAERALTTPPAGVGVMVCGFQAWPDARVRFGVIADVTACPDVVGDPDWRSDGATP